MATLEEAVRDLVISMPDHATRFPGGVYAQPIMPEDRTGPDGAFWAATPDAFDPLIPVQVLRSMSVAQQPRTGSITNWLEQYYDYVECWYYGPNTPFDKNLLSQAMESVRSFLKSRPVLYDSGHFKIMPANERTTLRPSGEFFNSLYGVELFVIVSYDT